MDSLSFDFAAFRGKYILVTSNQASGFILTAFTKDQSTKIALEFLHKISATYSYPQEIKSVNGLAFCSAFKAEQEKFGIFHFTSSPYNSSANRLAEHAIQTL